jgi:predicted outer membrane repeat protein
MSGNTATAGGGAVYAATGGPVVFSSAGGQPLVVRGNSAGQGGALYALDSLRLDCSGATFGEPGAGNRALAGSGGAIYLSQSVLTATNCLFRHNTATLHGGALAALTSTVTLGTAYPAAAATACDPLGQPCSNFYSNTADSDGDGSGFGGALYFQAGQLFLSNTYLHRNQAAQGGAMYQTGAQARSWLENALVYSNTSTLDAGAGVRVQAGVLTATHATLANNAGGAGLSHDGSTVNVFNSLIWGNSTPETDLPLAAACNLDQGGALGLALDPQFVAAGTGEDYRLQHSSPAVDACAAGAARDLDNRSRPSGLGFDMGAFERPVIVSLFLPYVAR